MRFVLASVLIVSLGACAPSPPASSFAWTQPAPGPACEGVAVDDGRRFLCLDDVGWHTAAQRCAAAGQQLAIVRDDEAQRAVEALLAGAGATGTDAPWIGLHKRAGALWWSDGAAATFVYFTPGEPNGGGSDPCIHLNWPTGSGTWNDARCDAAEPWSSFVCERPAGALDAQLAAQHVQGVHRPARRDALEERAQVGAAQRPGRDLVEREPGRLQ